MSCILIVEDDPEQARALGRSFAKLRPDLKFLTAQNGAAAIELLSERSVDLILTDLQMPRMDGFELVAWVLEHCPEIAVFTMSAYGTVDTDAQLARLGAIEYFPKPLDEKAALSRLAEALNQSVRGHVQNVSLASFLQLLEMERKSCTLNVRCDELHGVLVLRGGVLIGASTGKLEGEAAAIAIIAWPFPSITISRKLEAAGTPIQASLGFMVMEAMRVQDEAARAAGGDPTASLWPTGRRTWRPTNAPQEGAFSVTSNLPPNAELRLPSGALALAVVETETGNVLLSGAHADCPVGELARMASQLLRQQAATFELCNTAEGVEELVVCTTSRCDVVRPLGTKEFVLLVFAPEETNLVMARMELELFVASYRGEPSAAQRTP